MKKFLTILSLLILTGGIAHTQIIPFSDYHHPPDIPALALSPKDYSRFAALDSAELEAIILSLMDTLNVPGLSAIAVKNGLTFWQGQYGIANFAENRPVADSTLFMLASVSKPVTATALMQLWEQGYFELDDDINDYLPYPVINPDFPADAITFRQLLCHTSSIVDNWTILDPLAAVGDPTIPLAEFTQGYLVPGGTYYSPDNYGDYYPAQYWSYSNVSVTLIGYLIESLTELTFEQYCQQNLFQPLGMDETSWFLANLDTSNIAMPYDYHAGVFTPFGHMGRPWYPAGQLRTSAPQLARFLTAFIQNGFIDTVRILEPSTVDTMLTLQYTNLLDYQGIIWNYNFRADHWVWRHGGSSWGTRTVISFCPDDSIGVIVLTNGEAGLICDSLELLFYEFARTNTGIAAPPFDLTPSTFDLSAYPNPFNSSVTITFTIDCLNKVILSIFDIQGREITRLETRDLRLGINTVVWEADGVGSGVYFVRMSVVGGQSSVRKVVLVK